MSLVSLLKDCSFVWILASWPCHAFLIYLIQIPVTHSVNLCCLAMHCVYTAWHCSILRSYVYRSPKSWHAASSAVSVEDTKFASVPHGKLWPTGILVHRPSHLELTARTSVTNYVNWHLQALSENVFIRADIAFSALETFRLMAYISLLSDLLTYWCYRLQQCVLWPVCGSLTRLHYTCTVEFALCVYLRPSMSHTKWQCWCTSVLTEKCCPY